MSVLALQLAGPLQSWGATSRFARRTTENAPTKSGVIGLLAAALGIERGDDTALAELAALRFGVRIDQPGARLRDYQSAQHFDTEESMPLSERFYLADAVFVAALEGPAPLIERLYTAVRAPGYLPYLGRRSCPPSRPLDLHDDRSVHHDGDLESVLARLPWRASAGHQQRHRNRTSVDLTVLAEIPPGNDPTAPLRGDVLRDQPLSFDTRHRRHGLRTIRTTTVTVPNPHAKPRPAAAAPVPAHDPTTHLESA